MSHPLMKDTQRVFVSSGPRLFLGAAEHTYSSFTGPWVKPALISPCVSVAVARGYKRSAKQLSQIFLPPVALRRLHAMQDQGVTA